MKRTVFLAGLSALCLNVFVGCSIDSAQIVDHPAAVKPGQVFDVVLTNVYGYFSNSSVVSMPVTRDSLHVAIGVPAGWLVQSVDFYVAKDLKLVKYMDKLEQTEQMEQIFRDSLIMFASRKTAMNADPGLRTALAGRTVSAHDDSSSDETIDVSFDSVAQWSTFSSRAAITLASGSKLDTTISIDDSLLEGTSTDSLPFDSVGMSMVPIFVFARLKAPATEGQYELYYYTKTGKIGPANDTSILGAADDGDMAFYSINVSNNVAVKNGSRTADASLLKAYPNPFTDRVLISLDGVKGRKVDAGIYGIDGKMVRNLTGAKTGAMVWDGSDQNGKAVRPGSYILRVNDGARSLTKRIELVR